MLFIPFFGPLIMKPDTICELIDYFMTNKQPEKKLFIQFLQLNNQIDLLRQLTNWQNHIDPEQSVQG